MLSRLAAIPNLQVFANAPLRKYTRFGIGGPARVLADACTEEALAAALNMIRENGWACTVIGGGTNLIVDDAGFDGIVLRYTAKAIEIEESRVRVETGAMLQSLVDQAIDAGLRGLETMTGIPGWVGGAIYGNAGAYGHSIQERIESVRFLEGGLVHEIGNVSCGFKYRESIFKRHKERVLLSAVLRLDPAEASELRSVADGILQIRNEKYPPSMRCAGSIFKNLLLDELPAEVKVLVPERVIREGKVPSAYFLDQAGAKGLCDGGIRVADYHANLVYNTGTGTSAELRRVITELKTRVRAKFGFDLEEEVQYVGDEEPNRPIS
jgi:UDP-N-acetylmuramate dehydrogenase